MHFINLPLEAAFLPFSRAALQTSVPELPTWAHTCTELRRDSGHQVTPIQSLSTALTVKANKWESLKLTEKQFALCQPY